MLRVLGRGVEIAVDPGHRLRLQRRAGEILTVKGMRVLPLDELTHQLVQPLTEYCGVGAHDEVDNALAAILWKRPLILHDARTEDAIKLARSIHEHSIRKDFPFTHVTTIPRSDDAIEALFTEAGCGTIFLDLMQLPELPRTFTHHLFSEHFHLWSIAVVPTAKDAGRCFGPGMELLPICPLAYRGTSWHKTMKDVTFTQR
jgi:hypothetical protein